MHLIRAVPADFPAVVDLLNRAYRSAPTVADRAWSSEAGYIDGDRTTLPMLTADLVADNMLLYDVGCDEIIRTGFPVTRGLRWVTARDLFEQDVQFGAEFGYGLLQPMIRKGFLTDHGLTYGSLRYGEDMVFLAQILFAGARNTMSSP